MRAVAERLIAGMLAAAPVDGLFFGDFQNDWHEFCTFVRTVAIWLVLRQAAGAPGVISRLDFDSIRALLGNFRFWHVYSSAVCKK